MLFLYKDKVLLYYGINDKEEKMAELGLKLFQDQGSLDSYKKEVAILRQKIDEINSECHSIRNKDLSKKDLKDLFLRTLTVLDQYNNVYSKTEPLVLKEIENHNKNKDLVKKLGEIRLELRKESQNLYFSLIGILCKKITRKFNIKMTDLFFITFDELEGLFEEKEIDQADIKERVKGYALIFEDKKKKLQTGLDFKKIYKEISKIPEVVEFTGRVAMMGNAKGKVRVITHSKRNLINDIAKFKEGEILVTEMTRPDLVLICKKAAGIITDEGGISSHAAIIAREFRIPCLVGTKIATEVLKTGDNIKLDCMEGKVTLL